jgi:hypothetical protein
MWNRFSNRIKKAALCLWLLLLAAPDFAQKDKKSELDQQARQAAAVGNADEAARLYCEEAALDPRDPQLRQVCTEMKNEAERERKRNEQRFSEGVQAFKSGDLETAEQRFRNIRTGVHLDEAKRYLQQSIPAARAQAENDRSMEQKFEQGKQAYQNNDFGLAKTLLAQVTGGHASEAQDYLARIRQFEQAMTQGDTLAGNKDYKNAAASYSQAANIKTDGPGDPRGKAARMQSLLAAVPAHEDTAPTPTPTPVVATVTTPHTSPTEAAVKPSAHASFDVAKKLREAQAAQRKGSYADAMGKYAAVLVEDPRNVQARAALEDLKAKTSGSEEKASADADVMLSKAIREFYTGQYEDAEVHIKDYLGYKGSRTALSYFYLGVCKATRFYLGGEQEVDRKLLEEAREAFRNAKTAGFTAPGEKYISPKILKIYREI